MKKLFILAVGFIIAVGESTPTAATVAESRALAFETHWNRYIRSLFGCPEKGPTDETTCRLADRHIEYKEFTTSCEAAKKVFVDLTGSCLK